MSGIIYVLSHEAMPNLLKIGYTNRTISERVRELSSTGVPGKFIVELYFKTENAAMFEMVLHKALQEFRYEKEFFKTEIKTVIHVIHGLIKGSELHSYKFHGKCSALATTQEQVLYQRQIDLEKHQKLEEKISLIRGKYLDKSLYELEIALKIMFHKEFDYQTRQEINEIRKLIAIKKNEEQEKKRKALRKGKLIYETQLRSQYIELGTKVYNLLTHISPKRNTLLRKIAYKLIGYSFEDGKRVSNTLNQSQKQLVCQFYGVMLSVNKVLGYSNLRDLEIGKNSPDNLMIATDEINLTPYFMGIYEGCKLEGTSFLDLGIKSNVCANNFEWELNEWGLKSLSTDKIIPLGFFNISEDKKGIFINYKDDEVFLSADKVKNFGTPL